MYKKRNSSRILRREADIRGFYAKVSLANDFMIGLEFLLGSIQFLPGRDYTIGVYLFIIASFQILLIPTIRILRDIKLRTKIFINR